jgi:hypothetical protein
MARRDIDPRPASAGPGHQRVGQAAVPVTVSVHSTLLNGALIAERRYFSELVEGNPLPAAGMTGDLSRACSAIPDPPSLS